MTETLFEILALVPALVIAIVFHEVAHGYVAKLLGDPTASERGRLTLNPIRHVDPVGTLFVPGALALLGGPVFGWAKPVPVNTNRLRNPRFGMMAVAAAGPGSNLILAAIGALALGSIVVAFAPAGEALTLLDLLRQGAQPDPSTVAGFAMLATTYFIVINVFLALFNLLPIPPFDGSHIVEGLLPRSMAEMWGRLRQVGMFLFILLIAITWAFPDSGIIDTVVMPPVRWALDHYYSLAELAAGT